MTTMLSLILAFMLTMGGGPAANINISPEATVIQVNAGNSSSLNLNINEKPHLGEISKIRLFEPMLTAQKARIISLFRINFEKSLLAGYYYYRNRYYMPRIGRFLQTDPMGYEDSMNLYQGFNQNPVNFVDPFGLQEKEFYAMSIANRGDLDRIQFFQNQARKGYAKGAFAAAATFALSPFSAPTIIAICGSSLIYSGLEEYSDRIMAGQSKLEAKTGAILHTLTLGTYPIFAGRDAGTGDIASSEQKLKIVSDFIPYTIGGAIGIVSSGLLSRLNPSTSQLMDEAFRVLDFQRTSTGYVAITSDIGIKPGDPLPDNFEIVVTGGSNKPGSFILKPRDKLPLGQVQTSGKSASIATDLTLETEIPKMFGRAPGKHDILSGAFVEDIRAAGFDVIYAPTLKNPYHVRIIPNVNTFNETGRSYLSLAFDKILKYKKSSK